MGLAEITNEATGRDVLLHTLNNGIEVGLPKWAYCDHCQRYVQSNRITNHDVVLARVQAANITFRLPQGARRTQGAVLQAIAARLAKR